MIKRITTIIICVLFLLISIIGCNNNSNSLQKDDKERFNAVLQFANNVLERGRDNYSKAPTPLFADGIDVTNGEHFKWRYPTSDKKDAPVSDMAGQQTLFRTLDALSTLTNDTKYKDAAKAAINYMFEKYVDRAGLLSWGGHSFVNLETKEIEGVDGKQIVHELKNGFPYYDLMYQANPDATVKYIRAFWNAHMVDWNEVLISRHGDYNGRVGTLWENKMVTLPPHRESKGLSFINAGNDLIYSAAFIYRMTGDEQALAWAKHLAYQYVAARDPKTNLGVYQFTQAKRTVEPKILDDDANTDAKYGDRAKRQFGPEFGDVTEGKIMVKYSAHGIYVENALLQMQIARELGSKVEDVKEWTKTGLKAFMKYAYNKDSNTFKTMLTNGTDLTNYVLPRDGYYGKKGFKLETFPADSSYLFSYSRAFLTTKDNELWTSARTIASGIGFGDIGVEPGKDLKLDMSTKSTDSRAIFTMVDLYQATSNKAYLNLARVIGNNIIKTKFNSGFFNKGSEYRYAKFDSAEPLALLTLHAAIIGKLDTMPVFIDSGNDLNGEYKYLDGTIDNVYDSEIYDTVKK